MSEFKTFYPNDKKSESRELEETEQRARQNITGSVMETTFGTALSAFSGSLFTYHFIRGEVSASVLTGLGLSLGLVATFAGAGRLITSHAELSGIVTAKFISRFLSRENPDCEVVDFPKSDEV